MRSSQYARIEDLLAQADDITMERQLLTDAGREIQKMIRDALAKVSAERIRAEIRERTPRAKTSNSEDSKSSDSSAGT
jgi:hypothetical protein